jgi:hypothetical protein
MDNCTYLRDHRHSLQHSVSELIHEPVVAKTCSRNNPTLWNSVPSDGAVFVLVSAYAAIIGSSTSGLSFFNLTAQEGKPISARQIWSRGRMTHSLQKVLHSSTLISFSVIPFHSVHLPR